MIPIWLLNVLAVLAFVVGVASATQVAPAPLRARWWSEGGSTSIPSVQSRQGGADCHLANLLMGLAMAGMLTPGAMALRPHAWELIFGLLTTWFAWRLLNDARVVGFWPLAKGHRAAHFFHCSAMVYMFAATPSCGTEMMGGMVAPSLRYPYLALAFAVAIMGYCILDLRGNLSRQAVKLGAAPAGGATLAVACRSIMAVTMALMLYSES